MAKFKVGDICIGQHFEVDCELNGRECEVREIIPEGGYFVSHKTRSLFRIDAVCYRVEWQGGGMSYTHESKLKKKPPKGIELGSWGKIEKACGWNPTKPKTTRKPLTKYLREVSRP